MTATSGRQGRSCEGRMLRNQTSTTRNRPAKAQRICGLWINHKAQMPNAAKATASTSRNQAHGKLEKQIARVAQTTSRALQRKPIPANSQPSNLNNQDARIFFMGRD